LSELGLVDEVVPEPLGGAHNNLVTMAQTLRNHLLKHLHDILAFAPTERLRVRYEKFRRFGAVTDGERAAA
jgi:acetyl-CoA carboxylase carboxyl transferase subunit alpha